MMVSMETYLLRGKRRLDQWATHPGIRSCGKILLYSGGGFLMTAATAWGHMQPIAASMVCACSGIWAGFAAAGSVIGYRLLWGAEGYQGMVWTLLLLAAGLCLERLTDPERRTETRAAAAALVVAVTGLAFQLWMGDKTPLRIYLLRIGTAGGCAMLYGYLRTSQNQVAKWISASTVILALAGIGAVPWLNPGCVAAGILAAAAPLPAAALAGMGLEAAGVHTMTAGLCLACFYRMMPVRDKWRRLGAPAAGCLTAMVISGSWNWNAWLGISLGGLVGAVIPWHWSALPRQSGTAAAQVMLEQTAQVLGRLQRMLLEIPEVPVDLEAVAVKMRENACGDCSCRNHCKDQENLDARVLRDPLAFTCRKNGRVLREARRSQEQIRRMKAERARQGEYRSALVQQYGFLMGYLQLLADRLPIRDRPGMAQYHVQVSARSRGKEIADGDRCVSFPGVGPRYYVLLCDGMGTGMGAAEEGNLAADLLRQMLTAGLPPQYALGSINAHLALRGQAGAVTMDLAEIRLDSGRAAVYKWGAAPSLLLYRGKTKKIGTVTSPPGISVTQIRETVARLSLKRGEVLVLASDGIEIGDTVSLSDRTEDISPGDLAEQILRVYGGTEDDATAAVIRLRPVCAAGG